MSKENKFSSLIRLGIFLVFLYLASRCTHSLSLVSTSTTYVPSTTTTIISSQNKSETTNQKFQENRTDPTVIYVGKNAEGVPMFYMEGEAQDADHIYYVNYNELYPIHTLTNVDYTCSAYDTRFHMPVTHMFMRVDRGVYNAATLWGEGIIRDIKLSGNFPPNIEVVNPDLNQWDVTALDNVENLICDGTKHKTAVVFVEFEGKYHPVSINTGSLPFRE